MSLVDLYCEYYEVNMPPGNVSGPVDEWAENMIRSQSIAIKNLVNALSDLEEMARDCDDGQYMEYPSSREIFDVAREEIDQYEQGVQI